ncbi:nitrate ABC transporter permease [Arthrobacter sp. ERGS1:01]|uniref:ABC transporter permease n=1 Tax=Arthrobacter sp. ERGS1:01 TaxID=1704044 RepID=UPI0006B5F528|nr:ABC transporter permease subunit [Arthrobacter sp. ERGS1:01]ALE06315.1 nitrate ABC transporter permease [Arthrobacter sp. ERGS1:01]
MKTSQVTRGAIGLACAALLWQLVAMTPWGAAMPTFTATLAKLATDVSGSDFWMALAETVGVALLGLVSSAVVGILVGILIGSFPAFRYATLAVLEFLKPVPPIVILPLLVLILGPTAKMAWLLVFFGCVLQIVMQTVDGVHDTDPVAKDTARSYGMGRIEILVRVVLPSAMPFIGTAMRVAAPVALIVTVVAGLLGGGPGLGNSILLAQNAGDYPSLYALVLVLGLLGLVFIGLARTAERKLLHWHASYREAVV